MAKYKITWEENRLRSVVIDAESEEQAQNAFDQGRYDSSNERTLDTLIEEVCDIEEV